VDGLLIGLVLALFAVGLDLVFGILGIVNFAYGDFLMVALFAVYWGASTAGQPLLVAGALAIVPAAILGLALWGAMKPLGENQERQMLATLAFGILLQEGGNLLIGSETRALGSSYTSGTVSFAGVNVVTHTLVAGLACGALAVGVFLVSRRTRFGLQLRALAANETAARLYGIDRRKVSAITIAISSICVAAAATSLLPTLYVSPSVGISFTLLTYMAVIIGGSGTIVGAVVGAIIIELCRSIGGLWLDAGLPETVVVGILLVVLATRPQGLFGAKRLA
jgi:branched-chain amino acid transport system permease protein